MAHPDCILVDWGTTNFRAWLVAADGAVMDQRDAALGIMQVPEGGFPAALDRQLGAWRSTHPGLPVLMSGMVGSRQGWAEAPYLSCPASAEGLAGRSSRCPARRVFGSFPAFPTRRRMVVTM